MTRTRKPLAIIFTLIFILAMCAPPINLFTTKASAATPYAYNIKILSWSYPSVWTSKALTVTASPPSGVNLVGKTFTYRLYTVKSGTSSTCHELVKETSVTVGSDNKILIEETALTSGKRYTLDLEYIDTSTEPYTYYRAVMGHYAGSGSTVSNTDSETGETETIITDAGPQIVLESWSANGAITFKSQANKRDYDDYSYSNWYISKQFNSTSSTYLIQKQTGTSSGARFSPSGVGIYTASPDGWSQYVRCADKLKISGTWGLTYTTFMYLRPISSRQVPDAGFTVTGSSSSSGIFTVNPNDISSKYKIYLTTSSSYSTSSSYIIAKQSSYATTNSISFSGLDTTQQYYAQYIYGSDGITEYGWSSLTVKTPWTFSYSEALSPPSISTSATTNSVSVSVSTVSNASSYEVQLSSSSSFSSPTTKTGTSVTFTGLSPSTTYYVRAKSKSSSSGYTDSDWSSYTSIKTSSLTQLSAPTISTSVTQTSISVTLGSVSNASSYEIQLSSYSSYSSPTTKTGTSATFTGLSPGSTYYIRARALTTNSSYSNSEWNTRTVSTSSVTQLSAPTISTSTTQTSISVTLTTVSNASSYEIQLSSYSSYSSPTTKTGKSVTFTGLSMGTTYYIRAKAVAGSSSYSDSNWSTTTATTASVIYLSSPTVSISSVTANSAYASATTVSYASSYEIQYSTSSYFSSYSTLSSRTGTLSSLSANTTYYVRARAKTTTSGYADSNWSSAVSFTTSKYSMSAPSVSASNSDSSSYAPSISWSSITGAGSYAIQVSTSSSFGTLYMDTSTSSTSYSLGALPSGVTYYARVKARAGSSSYEDSSWSSYVSVINGVPTTLAAPTISTITPSGTSTISISWGSVSNASGYTIQYATNSSFSSATTVTTTSTTYTLQSLTAATTYYVRVRATSTSRYFSDSSYSSARSASTGLSAPSISLTTLDSSSITVTFEPVSGASKYVIEYSTSPSFTNKGSITV